MKVHIGPYIQWFGPYQIADMIMPWIKTLPPVSKNGTMRYDRWDYRLHDWLGDFLSFGFTKDKEQPKPGRMFQKRTFQKRTWIFKLCEFIHSKRKRKISVKLDYWDHWNVDASLSPIILPLLQELQKHKHGSGMVDLEDVPEHLRYTEFEKYEVQGTFEFYHEEGIDKLPVDVHTRYDWVLNEMIWTFTMLKNEYEKDVIVSDDGDQTDWKVYEAHYDRINNGCRLFGKYFRTLWD